MFYTRIPVPKSTGYSQNNLNRATKYLPLIGAIVGCVGALIFYSTSLILPLNISVLLSIASTILLTGAFHEDAFADFCDGFGGGYGKDRILDIMKDSRIGVYGAVGLLIMILSKFFSISEITSTQIPLVIILSHTYSRALPVFLISTSEYVSKTSNSKSKPVGLKAPWYDVLIAVLLAFSPLLLIPWQACLVIIPASIIIFLIFRAYVVKHIGGYTGDVLGALQQLTELAFYICFIVVQNNIL